MALSRFAFEMSGIGICIETGLSSERRSERSLVPIEPGHELVLADTRSATLFDDVRQRVVRGPLRVHKAPAIEPQERRRGGERRALVPVKEGMGSHKVKAQSACKRRGAAMHEWRQARVERRGNRTLDFSDIEALGWAAVARATLPVGVDDKRWWATPQILL